MSGTISLLAGNIGGAGNIDGIGSNALFEGPTSMSIDGSGNVYVFETGDAKLRRIVSPQNTTVVAGQPVADTVTTLASNPFAWPFAFDGAGNMIGADNAHNTILKISPAGVVTTLAGSSGVSGSADGTGAAASFNYPRAVTMDNAGNLYVSDTNDSTIRAITPAGAVTTIAGSTGERDYKDGPAASALFTFPNGITTDGAGNVYVADNTSGIREIDSSGTVSTLIAPGLASPLNLWGTSIVADVAGNIYIADFLGSIRKLSPAGVLTTIAGTQGVVGYADGTGAAASFAGPMGIALDQSGNLFVTDNGNQSIRKITPAGVVTTLAGSHGVIGSADGTGAAASFSIPEGIAVDTVGNVYVADQYAHTLRKITSAGVVTTLAGTAGVIGSADGTGSVASFHSPTGVAVDKNGNVYVADSGNNTIRKVTPAGVVTTIAGKAGSLGVHPGPLPGSLANPVAIAIDASGVLYVTSPGGVEKIQLQ